MSRNKRILLIAVLVLGMALGCETLAPDEPEVAAEPTAVEEPTAALDPTNTPPPPSTADEAAEEECEPAEEEDAPADEGLPGWERFEARGIEIWLPESFVGGDLSQDVGLIAENLRAMGPEYEQIAAVIEQNPQIYVIFATDSELGPNGVLTNMVVTTENALSSIAIEIFLDAVESQLPSTFNVISSEVLELNGREAGRMVVEFEVGGVMGKQLVYIIRVGNTMWSLAYSTSLGEFEERLPVFEMSAQSFTVLP